MKRNIVIFIVILILNLCNISCLKHNDSSTSSLAGTLGASTYYYRICGDFICKFSCKIDKASSLTKQNLFDKCKTPEAMQVITTLEETYENSPKKREIYTQIIDPIQENNKLNIMSVDNTLFKNFDIVFSGPENSCTDEEDKEDNKCKACKSSCLESNAALIVNPWWVIQEGSNFIYQKDKKDDKKSKLLWTGIVRKTQQGGRMSYQEAVKTCEEYNFRYSDWSLPTEDQWKIAIEEDLDNELLMTSIYKDIDEDVDSDLKNNVWIKDSKEDGSKYTICVRILQHN